MFDVQDELLSNNTNSLRIKNIAYHLQIFLIWVLFACFFDIVLYFLYFGKYSNYLNTWFYTVVALIAIISSSISYIVKNAGKFVERFEALFQFFCLMIGASLGIGVCIIYYYLRIETPQIEYTQLFILSGSLLSLVYIMALTYLAQRFIYFLCVFLPSALPVIFAQIIFLNQNPSIYSIIFLLWFTIILISAMITNQIHKRLENSNNKNALLIQKSQKILEESHLLQEQLQNEVNNSQAIKNELQLNNQLLEQKVKERILDFKQVNDRLENNQANLSFAHETAGIQSWVWNIERRTFEVVKTNNEIEFRQINLKYNDLNNYIHPDDIEAYKTNLRNHLKGRTERFEVAYRIKDEDEQWIWIQDIGKVIARNAYNKPLRMVGIHRNIQKEKYDQEQLELAANVIDQVAEGIFILDNNLCFLEVNPFFEKLLGYNLKEIVGLHLFDVTVNKNNEINKIYKDLTQKLLQNGEYESELKLEFTSGKKLILWVHINVITFDKNKTANYVGIITDLTERKKQEQRLSYLEHYDPLTNLPNRFYFKQKLHNYLTQNDENFKHFAVLRINIDRFKSFNEFMSHANGDELLKLVAERLRQYCNDASFIAYLNNDDFAVIYNLNNHISIHQHAQNLLYAFRHPFTLNKQEHVITISIGIALYPEHSSQLDNLNGNAEIALKEAKRLGGNTAHFYSNTKTPFLNHGVNLESELRKAIKFKTLSVHYQPKVCIQTHRIYGFEALLRWHHTDLGTISPDIFIPLAEETNLISNIGLFVLDQTCKQIRSWQKLGFDNLRVSINVVAQQIHRGHLIKDIDFALNKYKISGDMLELELTETSLLDKSEQVFQFLQQLKDRHISISLDDFGTGYSSLAYLTSYPIDTLKIDKAFISKIGQEKDEAIVTAIIAMGKAIGITLVAEGVETKEQALFLEKHGCYILQGFYFSKALSTSESIQYLEQHKSISL